MNWHFMNKTIYRKLVMLLAAIMGVVLSTKANLMGCQGLTERPEINYFIETQLLGEIKLPYNIFFGVLLVVGTALCLMGWKRYSNNHRDGVWLTNIATGYLATVFLGYGLTTTFLLKASSWEVVCAFVISVMLYILLGINLVYYKKNKDVISEEKGLKRVVVSGVIAMAISVGGVAVFAHAYDYIYEASYKEFREYCSDEDYGFLQGELDYRDYVRLQFVNYFNQDGEHFTYDELKESIENYQSDSGSWYALWYCNGYVDRTVEYINNNRFTFQINFNGYGYYDAPHKGFLNFVTNQLQVNGISPSKATYEQLDEACEYVYETYINKTPPVVLGDDEGEIVVHITIPEDGNVEQVQVTWENEGYYAFVSDWYQVSEVGQGYSKDAEPVQVLEKGKLYYTKVYYNFALPYVRSDIPAVQLDVIGGQLVNEGNLGVKEPIDIWVIPGSTN